MRTVAIIGAGFSGTLAAVHLLREAPDAGLRVVLVNQSGRMARGLAYGTRSDVHVLNVPAGNMSALPDDPEHFLRYCRWADPTVAPGDFVPRKTYGCYLDALLSEVEHRAGHEVCLERVSGAVVSVELIDNGQRAALQLGNGARLEADQVILAFGHFAPADPLAVDDRVRASGRYVRDPWGAGALERISAGDVVAVLGSGLTAVDIVVALHQRQGPVTTVCFSRRGLAPLPHRQGLAARPAADVMPLLVQLQQGARTALQVLRREANALSAQGGDWRDLLASLRRLTPSIWRAWSVDERARFLRHLQPYWDVHRHRCAPQAHEAWQVLRQQGLLRVQAGRLRRVEVGEDGRLCLHWNVRGSTDWHVTTVDWLLNCTGPDARLRRAGIPLIERLLADGLLCPDVLELGLQVGEGHALLDRFGRPSSVLRYVGPLLRARDWEATAVPELREQAQAVSVAVLSALATGDQGQSQAG